MQNSLLCPVQTPTLAAFVTGEAIAPLWVSPSGRAFYPIAGGALDDDDPKDDPKDDDDPDDDPDDDDPKDDPKDGEPKDDDAAGWKAKFEAEQRHKRNLERKARKDATTIARLTGKKPEGGGKKDDDGDKVDAEKIREEAKSEARRESLAERVADKIEAKASKFADPEDAVAVLLRSREIDDFLDDDKVDVEAITDALKELGEKKPHLLAEGSRFKGGVDGGRRKGKDSGRPKDLGDAISRHYDSGSK